ncbi:MAG: HEAT repeat domain-containing protein [Bacteroidales bacterium]|nr:HEAT repeat domain-containing protein [Bacteroidales bacterium]
MECKNIQNVLIDFIEENISADIKIQIEEHLLTCKTCRTEHKQTRQLLDDMQIFEDEQPDEQLKVDFYTMLEVEKEQLNTSLKNIKSSANQNKDYRNYLKYAASIIVLLSLGFFLGQSLQIKSYQSAEIAALRSEIYSIQQTATMASLRQPTASQRLNAVNVINEQLRSDDKTINTLVNTFRSDDNINVRMAAANALVKYSESEEIRDAFIEVLEKEEDPALQITLINLLTQMQESRAKKIFQEILNNDNTIPVVKEQVQEGLKVFI